MEDILLPYLFFYASVPVFLLLADFGGMEYNKSNMKKGEQGL